MTDQELRSLVRDAIARRLRSGSAALAATDRPPVTGHASHALYHLINQTDACLIEPAVLCNHCGYCKSHGH